MRPVTPEVQELAQMLLASEPAADPAPHQWATTADRTWGLLRAHLVRLIGLQGFVALLSRSLALAKTGAPWLDAAQVAPDGSLQDVRGGAAELDAGRGAEVHAAILAQFIGLLILFIGEALTRRVLGDVWPEVMLGNTLSGSEAKAEQ